MSFCVTCNRDLSDHKNLLMCREHFTARIRELEEENNRLRRLLDFSRGNPNNDEDMCPNCVTPWKCNGPHWDDE